MTTHRTPAPTDTQARVVELEAEMERREILIRDVLREWVKWDEATPMDVPLRKLADHINKYLPTKEEGN